ncbi:hypothetical protein [Deinococcus deserti]|uniref:hypothetical protein n=1 Tax=Deinococcus deserti TaxID=310783 RepID=UPI0013922C91|nr:hypothetical protein [Deinococcus deserti]
MNEVEQLLHSWALEIKHEMPKKIQEGKVRARRNQRIRLVVAALLIILNIAWMTGIFSLSPQISSVLFLALFFLVGSDYRYVKELQKAQADIKQFVVMKHYASAIYSSPDGIDDERCEHLKSFGVDLDDLYDQEEEQREVKSL